MKKLFILFIALLTPVLCTADPQLDVAREKLEAARLQLDEAARRFAELSADISLEQFTAGENRAFLGVLIGKVDEKGIHLVGVTPGGSADKAGVEAGDIIISIEAVDLTGLQHPQSELSRVMANKAPGDFVSLDVLRSEDILRFDLEAGKGGMHKVIKIFRSGDLNGLHGEFDFSIGGMPPDILHDVELNLPASAVAYRMIEGGGFHDLTLVDMDENLSGYFGVVAGVLVLRAPADAGLRSGDILETISGEPVSNAASAHARILQQDDSIELQVRRQGASETIQLQPVKGMNHFMGKKVTRIIRMGHDSTSVGGLSQEIEVLTPH